jgi:hypothetical protein
MKKIVKFNLLVLSFLLPGTILWAGGEKRYAIIVANNTPLEKGLGKLKYADDDGVKFYKLFSALTKHTILLSTLDSETQKLYPEITRRTLPPTKKELLRAINLVIKKLERDKKKRIRTELYFVLVGHGNIKDNGEGYISLLDGSFSRKDLYNYLLSKSQATFNHIIIDACHSFYMVKPRGKWKDDREALSRDLELIAYLRKGGEFDRYPNTGYILSTAGNQEVYEWVGFKAGVFSHQLLSGMLGAADVNLDGKVDYHEIGAFLAAANYKVPDPRAKIRVFVHPPTQNQNHPLIPYQKLKAKSVLIIPQNIKGRFTLEGPKGERYADFNKSPEGPLHLALILSSTAKTEQYFLKKEGDLYSIKFEAEKSKQGIIRFQELKKEEPEIKQRGRISNALREGLFAIPFGESFFAGYLASSQITLEKTVERKDEISKKESTLIPKKALSFGFVLSSPFLNRDGWQKGEEISFRYRFLPPLFFITTIGHGYSGHKIGKYEIDVHGISMLVGFGGEWPPNSWFAFYLSALGGYMMIIENGWPELRADFEVFRIDLRIGAEIKVTQNFSFLIDGSTNINCITVDKEGKWFLTPQGGIRVAYNF